MSINVDRLAMAVQREIHDVHDMPMSEEQARRTAEALVAACSEVAEPVRCVECGETWPCRGVRAPTKADRAIPHRMVLARLRAEVAEPGDGHPLSRALRTLVADVSIPDVTAVTVTLGEVRAATAGREPLDARIRGVIAEHEAEGGYARFGGDALLRDVRAALDTPDPGAS